MHGAGPISSVPIEVITAYSYLLIALGYGLRQALETKPQLLWPWMLVSIFLLCGATRVTGFIGAPVPDALVIVMHVALAPLSLSYGLGQLAFAFWPGLFDQEDGSAGGAQPAREPTELAVSPPYPAGRDLARELEKRAFVTGDATA